MLLHRPVAVAALTLCLATAACAQGAPPTTMDFVKDGAAVTLETIGPPWTPGQGFLEGVGKSDLRQRLLGRCVIGPGDCTIRARIAILKLASSAACFGLGDKDDFGFAGGHGKVFLTGPLFNNAWGKPIGEPTDFMHEGQPFDFVFARAGGQMTITIDGKQVYTQAVGPQALGAPSLLPYRATIRVYSFSATGNLLPYQAPAFPMPEGANVMLDPRVKAMPGLPQGPFVRLKDGGILAAEGTDVLTSHDEGKTWQRRPLFGPAPKMKLSTEQALLRTRAGTIILLFIDMADCHYSWDQQKNLPLPDMRAPSYSIRSTDEGQTWTDLNVLTPGWCGADQDMIETQDGTIVVPSQELLYDKGRHATMPIFSRDEGKTWTHTARYLDIGGQGDHAGAIEATLEQLRDGTIWMLLRTPLGAFYESRSTDNGQTWSEAAKSAIPATSAPGKMKRLADGRLVLLWNAPPQAPYKTREELSIAFSEDEGKTWTPPQTIATNVGGRVSYLHMFEREPGELWVTTMQGGLRARLHEADFLKPLPTVVAFGDSTTATREGLTVYAQLLRPALLAQGKPARVVNAGVGGNTSADGLARLQKDVLDLKPAVVVLQFGINDSAVDVWKTPPATAPRVPVEQFRRNLTAMLDKLQAQGARAVLMTPNPLAWSDKTRELYGKPPYDPANPDGFNVTLRAYVAAVRELAGARNVPLVDVFAAHEAAAAQSPDGLNGLLLDGMHPNQAGQQLVAEKLGACLAGLVPAVAGP